MDIAVYFDELNQDVYNAQFRKTLRVLRRRARRIYKNLINNPSSSIRTQVLKQYRNSLKLIGEMMKKLP